MTLTVAQSFSKFLEDITATDNQKSSFIPNRKTSVDEDLSAAFPSTSDMPYWKGLLMGSASKNTIIRPLSDIDVCSNQRESLQKFFEWAPNHLRVDDPGGQGGDLSSYLTQTGRQNLIQALNVAADRAKKAIEAEARNDPSEAKRLWRIILGDAFPTS